ncbi:hypothetical protein BDZ89DRAFT_1193471, partial [Hymenopellis radicata]
TTRAGYLGSSLIDACLITCGFNTNASKVATIVLAVFFLLTLWWARRNWLTWLSHCRHVGAHPPLLVRGGWCCVEIPGPVHRSDVVYVCLMGCHRYRRHHRAEGELVGCLSIRQDLRVLPVTSLGRHLADRCIHLLCRRYNRWAGCLQANRRGTKGRFPRLLAYAR